MMLRRGVGTALAVIFLLSALLVSGGTASAQTQCPPGQVSMPRKPPSGAFVAGKCVASSAVSANQTLQIRDKVSCPATLRYDPRKPGGRSCVYWDEPG
jgi:hypothetical protein